MKYPPPIASIANTPAPAPIPATAPVESPCFVSGGGVPEDVAADSAAAAVSSVGVGVDNVCFVDVGADASSAVCGVVDDVLDVFDVLVVLVASIATVRPFSSRICP